MKGYLSFAKKKGKFCVWKFTDKQTYSIPVRRKELRSGLHVSLNLLCPQVYPSVQVIILCLEMALQYFQREFEFFSLPENSVYSI